MITMLRCSLDPDLPNRSVSGAVFQELPKGFSKAVLSTGRAAIAHLLRVLELKAEDVVLCPAYIAEGVIQPIRNSGIKVEFYRLLPDMTVDLSSVTEILARVPNARLLIALHPFGFEAPLKELRSILHSKGVLLLSDCAQALYSRNRENKLLGSEGDFSLFSLNKFLPVADGAVLLSHRSDIDVSPSFVEESDDQAVEYYVQHLQTDRKIREMALGQNCEELLKATGREYDSYYTRINNDLAPRRLSAYSERVLSQLDHSEVCAVRRRNAELLYQGLKNPVFHVIFPNLPSGVVPFCVPAQVPEGSRDLILTHLLRHGVLLSTLQDRWDFIPSDRKSEFAVENAFMRRNVLLPINEFLSADDMRYLVKTLNAVRVPGGSR